MVGPVHRAAFDHQEEAILVLTQALRAPVLMVAREGTLELNATPEGLLGPSAFRGAVRACCVVVLVSKVPDYFIIISKINHYLPVFQTQTWSG